MGGDNVALREERQRERRRGGVDVQTTYPLDDLLGKEREMGGRGSTPQCWGASRGVLPAGALPLSPHPFPLVPSPRTLKP
eukprot:206765-Chlamydomonas_euryale.AAC.2